MEGEAHWIFWMKKRQLVRWNYCNWQRTKRRFSKYRNPLREQVGKRKGDLPSPGQGCSWRTRFSQVSVLDFWPHCIHGHEHKANWRRENIRVRNYSQCFAASFRLWTWRLLCELSLAGTLLFKKIVHLRGLLLARQLHVIVQKGWWFNREYSESFGKALR